MERSLAEVEAIVRDKICRVCSDRTIQGNCGLETTCGLCPVPPASGGGEGYSVRPKR
jgi:hypothetical protein